MVLDEPTAGLDIEARHGLWEVIRELRRSGASVLMTTHLLDEAEALSDRVGFLHEGRIARQGTLTELYATVPATQVAEVKSDDEEAVRERVQALGLELCRRAGALAVLLPGSSTLESLVAQVAGTGVRSVALRPVRLEDIYLEVAGAPTPGKPASVISPAASDSSRRRGISAIRSIG